MRIRAWSSDGGSSDLLSGDDDEEGGFFGGRGEREYNPLTVLAVAWACVKLEGFKPASSYGSTTKGDVMTALSPSKSKHDREWAAKIAPLADEAADKAAQLLAWILRSEEHTSELQSLMRISYAVFC